MANGPSQFTISVKLGPTGSVLQLSVGSASSIAELKSVACAKEGLKSDAMKVVFGGLELEDGKTVEQCEIKPGASLYLLPRVKQTHITVKTLKDRSFTIAVDGATNVAELKKCVSEQDPQWEVARQRIIFQGRELDDADVLSQSGLDNEVPCVHLVMRLQNQGATTRRSGRREEPAKRAVAKPAVKVEPAAVAPEADPLNDQVYGGLEDARLDLDETLGGFSPLPMELDTVWKDFSEEPALPSSGGWMNGMEAGMDTIELPPPTPRSPPAVALPAATVEPVMAAPQASIPAPAPAAKQAASNSKAVPALSIQGEDDLGPAGPSTQGRAYDLTKVDDKLRKRLLKNRLSAERSRQRKQAHVETLEFELSCCRSENEALKKRVASLEHQLAQLSIPGGAQSVALRPQMAVA
eukprot:CAMPEP_0174952190 /NCGR_PEP_ID=MMETSP1355-20121228/95242_1 /TAXON_ID=464990 /ORGANISM="Hemiselmis tepida, Strain CCMP443" /LENGTH=408 /DNA_ID=CAMNT_0016199877 /DNA_START=19 /DNA_END=1245 /DNA_ORIENTATION=+